jgi:hypothetical protein
MITLLDDAGNKAAVLHLNRNGKGIMVKKDYCIAFDSYYDSAADIWLDDGLGDEKCHYCKMKPKKPSLLSCEHCPKDCKNEYQY